MKTTSGEAGEVRPKKRIGRPPNRPEDFFRFTSPEPNSGCVLWTGSYKPNGYGQFQFGRRYTLAHRLAWELEYGPIPDGLVVRHFVCANPACVNPRHLRIGTPKDNVHDCIRDGHFPRGDKNGSRLHPERLPRGNNHWSRKEPNKVARGARNGFARLTDDLVRLAVRLHESGQTTVEIAKTIGIHRTTIGLVLRGKTWTHVTGLLSKHEGVRS